MALSPPGAALGIPSGGLSPLPANTQEDEFTATGGQTVFALTQPFLAGSMISLSINGQLFAQGTNYTAVGTTLTWLDTPFTLVAGDCVVVAYNYA